MPLLSRKSAASVALTLALTVGLASCGSGTDTATDPTSMPAAAATPDGTSPAATTARTGPLPASACALLTEARAKQVIPDATHHGKKDPPVICSYASKNVSTGKKGQTLTLLWSRKKVSAANLKAAFDQSNADLSGGATLRAVSGIGERANLISSPGAGATMIWTEDGYLLVCSYLDYSGQGSPSAIQAVENITRAMSQSF